jgi:two-component sensor histidine kinase
VNQACVDHERDANARSARMIKRDVRLKARAQSRPGSRPLRKKKDELSIERLSAPAGSAPQTMAHAHMQRLLLEELHHRIKNTLATVIAITSQSLRSAQNLEEGKLAIESRLLALGKVHGRLIEENSTSERLIDVVRDSIAPFESQVSGAHRFVVSTDYLQINSKGVLALALSLNELCTNATKYGALSDAGGHVEITSGIDAFGGTYRLRWEEIGGPEVEEPTRRGFGTRLITRLVKQFNGKVSMQYRPQGLICEFKIPLDDVWLKPC